MNLLTPDYYQRLPPVAPDHRYSYGRHPQQFGELTLPPSAPPHPIIVLIHGGCYREMYDLRPLGTVAANLSDAGFAVWNIEYRRHGNGGDYPTMFLDVAAAADYLRQIAAEHHLNLNGVITVGHSAGGHLALWLAGRRLIRRESPLFVAEPLSIGAVMALAPLADIERAYDQGMCADALTTVMGGTPATAPQHYQDGSPSELLPLGIPQALIVGSEDADILENSKRYFAAATALGDAAELIVVPGAGHFEIVAVDSTAWDDVRHAVLQLGERVRRSCNDN